MLVSIDEGEVGGYVLDQRPARTISMRPRENLALGILIVSTCWVMDGQYMDKRRGKKSQKYKIGTDFDLLLLVLIVLQMPPATA